MNNDTFSSWAEFEKWLNKKGLFHIELGLGRASAALAMLGLSSLPYRAAQVLGTNGKGSTSSFLASIAEAHGIRTGLYLSPHFLSPKERILINGRQLSERDWLEGARSLSRVIDIESLTYFEFLTVQAAWLFAANEVKFAVFEAGLGGRNDATSALATDCHCFTPIALDHAQIIGPGIGDIASDKAAAIRPGSLVYSTGQYAQAAAALEKEAARKNATLAFAGPAKLGLTMAGNHQLANAGLALAAWRGIAAMLDARPDQGMEAAGLKNAFLPGRMQRLEKTDEHPEIILDCAHNPHAIAQLCNACEIRPQAIIYSALSDKDWRSCVATLLRMTRRLLVPQLSNSRAASAAEICSFANAIRAQGSRPLASMKEALENAGEGPILICGSLYLLAEFYNLYPQYLERKKNV